MKKIKEVTLRILLQFTSFPLFSLAPVNFDENTLLAVNRRDCNIVRGVDRVQCFEFCPRREGKSAELLPNYRMQMRVCGRNWEAPNANKIRENRSVRIEQVELANRPP